MFDKEELEILEAFENDNLKQSINMEEEISLAKESAKEYLTKSKNITIRLNMGDLHGIKAKALETGIPYQTLINALIHQYVSGQVKLAS
ncbi:MAG: hypothetical protein COB67_07155 [SAR324 cluster bacterium]|uniref:Antitoxin n=1 Tax=SAR324 cluster bacterium TaxID=2024889 RepID=A0A2A4T380_9DELT|nr:MAG: hypothetical protein COB67_07155 [SAR324 cluster bacterium]